MKRSASGPKARHRRGVWRIGTLLIAGLTALWPTSPTSAVGGSSAAGTPQPPSYVGDRVFDDRDLDGVQDDAEGGIAGVRVFLLDSRGRRVGPATVTGREGDYLLEVPRPGIYDVRFELPAGYRPSRPGQGNDPVKDSDAEPVTSRARVRVARGEVNRTVDVGAMRPASLSARVFEDRNGNGVDDAEPGVNQVTVRLLDPSYNVIAESRTDKDGRYSFEDVEAGSYRVRVERPDGAILTALKQGPRERDSDIEPVSGDTGLFTVTPTRNPQAGAGMWWPAAVGDLVFDDINGDGVRDAGEVGLANVQVSLLDTGGRVVATQDTGPDGSYLLMGLAPGTYILVVSRLPEGAILSPSGRGGDGARDSDPDPKSRRTAPFTLASRQTETSLDAGAIPARGGLRVRVEVRIKGSPAPSGDATPRGEGNPFGDLVQVDGPEIFEWRITVANAGNAALRDVAVTSSVAGCDRTKEGRETEGLVEMAPGDQVRWMCSNNRLSARQANAVTASGQPVIGRKDFGDVVFATATTPVNPLGARTPSSTAAPGDTPRGTAAPGTSPPATAQAGTAQASTATPGTAPRAIVAASGRDALPALLLALIGALVLTGTLALGIGHRFRHRRRGPRPARPEGIGPGGSRTRQAAHRRRPQR